MIRPVALGLCIALLASCSGAQQAAAPSATAAAPAPAAATTTSAPASATTITTPSAAPTAATSPAAPTGTVAPASACSARGPLPDPVCTPGAADPRVTQANIGTTICVSGYTTTVRPPVSYTEPLKVQQMAAYGFTGSTADYEEDHLIALEIGGDPRDPHNLWPEPRTSTPGATQKDTLENRLHTDVCAGRITLAEAQREMATDWVGAAGLGALAPTPPPATQTPATAAPTVTAPPAVTTAPPLAAFAVTITASDWGSLAASTSAGASCIATARYANGNLSAAAGITVTKIADGTGVVSWTYTKTPTTTKGTGTHTVTCSLNGQSATASATFVVQ